METIIFRTLLHSLWQGLLLAVLTAIIISVTTRANAGLRYNLFVGCLVLFIGGVGATFCIELFKSVPSASENMLSLGNPVFGDTIMQTGIAKTLAGPAIVDNLIAYLNKYSSSIVLVWLLIICAKSIRFMADIRTLMQIRTTQVYHAGTMLSEKVKNLALQYGIKQKIHILQSGIVKVPMVLGHFKPLILVPLGLINGLSMEAVDAILSHEMAHIKRRDYLVNILQSVAEILFFFNPAVLWVSNMIRTEREHCCDDLAVSTVKTKMDYIKALVSCQEFASVSPSYAMAITGGKSRLVYRVQRLISSRNKSLNNLEKVIIALVLISAVAITTAFSRKETKVATVASNEIKAAQVKNEDNSDRIYKQMIKDGLAKANADLHCTLDENAFVINGKKQSAALHAKYAQLYLEKGQKLSYRFEKDYKKQISQDVSPVRKTTATADAPQVPAPPLVPKSAAGNGRKVPVVQTKGKNDMTKDLIADKLIEDEKNFSYQLNIDELLVNGEKQPDAIHRKYRSKYLKTAKQNLTVRVSTN